jgi:hypothetical protein
MKTFITTLVLMTSLASQAQLKGGLKYFTNNDRLRYETMGIALSQVFFYPSMEIMIKREMLQSDPVPVAMNGQIRFEGGKRWFYYAISPKRTFIYESEPDKKSLVMRIGTDQDQVLKFKLVKGSGNDSNEYYVLDVNQDKTVNFWGNNYELVVGQNSRLAFKEKGKSKTKIKVQKAKGMKLDGTEKGGLKVPKVL